MEQVISPEWTTQGCTWPTKKDLHRRLQQETEQDIEQAILQEQRRKQALSIYDQLQQQALKQMQVNLKATGQIRKEPSLKPASAAALHQLQARFSKHN